MTTETWTSDNYAVYPYTYHAPCNNAKCTTSLLLFLRWNSYSWWSVQHWQTLSSDLQDPNGWTIHDWIASYRGPEEFWGKNADRGQVWCNPWPGPRWNHSCHGKLSRRDTSWTCKRTSVTELPIKSIVNASVINLWSNTARSESACFARCGTSYWQYKRD